MDLMFTLSCLQQCRKLHTIIGVECFDVGDSVIEIIVSFPELVNCKIVYKPEGISEIGNCVVSWFVVCCTSIAEIFKLFLIGIGLLRRKPTFERVNFPADLLLDSLPITDPSIPKNIDDTTSTSPPQLPLPSSFQPWAMTVFEPTGLVSINTLTRALTEHPALIILDFTECELADVDGMIEIIVKSAPKIARLGLSNQKQLTDAGIKLLKNLSGLRELVLANTTSKLLSPKDDEEACITNISDEALVEASSGWSNLEVLELDGSPVAAANLARIVRNCTNLRVLSIYGCINTKDEDIAKMNKPGLKVRR